MDSEYFYNKLIEYDDKSVRVGKYYDGYSNNYVTIQHKGDDSIGYTNKYTEYKQSE